MQHSPSHYVTERKHLGWTRTGGILLSGVTFLSMARSAEWNFGLVLTDPLFWMTLLLAAAAGLVAGYAFGHWLNGTDEV